MEFVWHCLFNYYFQTINKLSDIFIVYMIFYIYFCKTTKRIIMDKGNSKREPIRMFDREKKLYVKIKLNSITNHWERWVSKTKNKWEMTHSSLSLAEVIRYQEEIVSNNYHNFYKMFFRK